MSLSKQAKVLSKGQVDAVLGFVSGTRHVARNRVILLLSVRAGLSLLAHDGTPSPPL
jgi:hypothetical protein